MNITKLIQYVRLQTDLNRRLLSRISHKLKRYQKSYHTLTTLGRCTQLDEGLRNASIHLGGYSRVDGSHLVTRTGCTSRGGPEQKREEPRLEDKTAAATTSMMHPGDDDDDGVGGQMSIVSLLPSIHPSVQQSTVSTDGVSWRWCWVVGGGLVF